MSDRRISGMAMRLSSIGTVKKRERESEGREREIERERKREGGREGEKIASERERRRTRVMTTPLPRLKEANWLPERGAQRIAPTTHGKAKGDMVESDVPER